MLSRAKNCSVRSPYACDWHVAQRHGVRSYTVATCYCARSGNILLWALGNRPIQRRQACCIENESVRSVYYGICILQQLLISEMTSWRSINSWAHLAHTQFQRCSASAAIPQLWLTFTHCENWKRLLREVRNGVWIEIRLLLRRFRRGICFWWWIRHRHYRRQVYRNYPAARPAVVLPVGLH